MDLNSLFNEIKTKFPNPGHVFIDSGENQLSKKALELIFNKYKASEHEKEKLKNLYLSCLDNAKLLTEEAKLLFNNNHYSRASFLAITAYEEIAKAELVRYYYNGVLTTAQFKETFKNHIRKNSVLSYKISSDHRAIIFNEKHGKRLFDYRNSTLYVSEHNNPQKIKQKDHAKFFIDKSDELVSVKYATKDQFSE